LTPSIPVKAEGSLDTRIVRRVAAATNRELRELPILYDTVDPEALDDLLAPGTAAPELSVAFTYAGTRVTVTGSGRVTVARIDPRTGVKGLDTGGDGRSD
jgi:hypothetical protein